MRWPLLIAVVTLAATAGAHAQTRTRCTTTDGLTVDCRTTTNTAPPIADYAGGLKAAEATVPAYQDNRLANEQIEALRLSNQMKRREMQRQDAPGYDRKQCRKSAAAALSADDLTLARDVLNACAGDR